MLKQSSLYPIYIFFYHQLPLIFLISDVGRVLRRLHCCCGGRGAIVRRTGRLRFGRRRLWPAPRTGGRGTPLAAAVERQRWRWRRGVVVGVNVDRVLTTGHMSRTVHQRAGSSIVRVQANQR